ncbi:MAG: ABC transporter permease [Chloroflexi bacterium]|nr:ABC transporter permease [Chloroflexota bacterium]
MSSESLASDIAILKTEIIAPPLTPQQLILRRFSKHRLAIWGMVGFGLLLLFIIVGSILVTDKKANEVDLMARLSPPNQLHWMGTDSTGRDIFARMIHGGQISLIVGFLSVIFSVSVGAVVGGVAAYYGGWVDTVLMRFTEAMLSIPSLFLLIVLGKYLGKDVQTITVFGHSYSGSVAIVIVVIGATSWMYLARIVRANVLSLREMDYISASKSLGASDVRIFFRHLIPNTMGAIIVSSTLGLAGAILNEAYVSFLGLGVQPPTASWGNMLTSAQSFIQRGAWWMWVFPSLFIIITILCINLIGDGLRDAFDPRSTRNL